MKVWLVFGYDSAEGDFCFIDKVFKHEREAMLHVDNLLEKSDYYIYRIEEYEVV